VLDGRASLVVFAWAVAAPGFARTRLCLACRSSLGPDDPCELHAEEAPIALAVAAERRRLYPPPARAARGRVARDAGRPGKADRHAVLRVVAVCVLMAVVGIGALVGHVGGPSGVILLCVSGLFLLVVIPLASWSARRHAPRPPGPCARAKPRIKASREGTIDGPGPVLGRLLVLRYATAAGGGVTLRDAEISTGCTVTLDSGERAVLAPGRAIIDGPRGLRGELSQREARRELERVGIDPPGTRGLAPFPFECAYCLELRPGDRVAVGEGLEEEDVAAEGGYRAAPTCNLRVPRVPALRIIGRAGDVQPAASS
jgi:hypothetical protein